MPSTTSRKTRTFPFAPAAALIFMVGCSAGPAPQQATRQIKLMKADLRRLEKKCDVALAICRYSLLPDLSESWSGGFSMLGVLLAPSDDLTTSVEPLFGFQTASNKVRYRECDELQISVDRAPLPPRPVEYHVAMDRSRVVEGVTVELSLGELLRMSRGDQVSCTICGEKRELQRTEKVLLAALFEMWRTD